MLKKKKMQVILYAKNCDSRDRLVFDFENKLRVLRALYLLLFPGAAPSDRIWIIFSRIVACLFYKLSY